jgi:hypothetical protein
MKLQSDPLEPKELPGGWRKPSTPDEARGRWYHPQKGQETQDRTQFSTSMEMEEYGIQAARRLPRKDPEKESEQTTGMQNQDQ